MSASQAEQVGSTPIIRSITGHHFDTKSIEVGVRFLFAKATICKWFHTPFNESKLYGNAIITVKKIFDFTGSQTLVGFGTELKNGNANRSVFKLSYGRRTAQSFVICASVYTEKSAKSGD